MSRTGLPHDIVVDLAAERWPEVELLATREV